MSAASQPASDRFLDAYNAIDKLLRARLGADRTTGFYSIVERVAVVDRAVQRYSTDLKEFADLRNAIVHERTDGRVIAEPHPETALRLEAILEQLRRPPKLGDLFRVRVVVSSASAPIGQAAKAMLDGNFSQMPVYDGDRFVSLLTSETIARWLGDQLASGIGLLEEAGVREVLHYTEDPEHYKFRARTATVFDALADFDEFARRGKFLDAILVTNSGEENEKLLGIVTVFDIPKLHAAADVRSSFGGAQR